MPRLNKKLLERVKQTILEEPLRFSMGNWLRRIDPGLVAEYNERWPTGKYPRCGTVACISGWASVLEWKDKGGDSLSPDLDYGTGPGAKLLGLSSKASNLLFFEENWPEEFLVKYRKARTSKGRARVAAALIDTVLEKGKVWWKAPPSSLDA